MEISKAYPSVFKEGVPTMDKEFYVKEGTPADEISAELSERYGTSFVVSENETSFSSEDCSVLAEMNGTELRVKKS